MRWNGFLLSKTLFAFFFFFLYYCVFVFLKGGRALWAENNVMGGEGKINLGCLNWTR